MTRPILVAFAVLLVAMVTEAHFYSRQYPMRIGRPVVITHNSPMQRYNWRRMGQHSMPMMRQHSMPMMGQHSMPMMGQHSRPMMGQHSMPMMGQQAMPMMGQQAMPSGDQTQQLTGPREDQFIDLLTSSITFRQTPILGALGILRAL